MQKISQKEFRDEKAIKKVDKPYAKLKVMLIILTVGLIKNTKYKLVNIFQNQNF